MKAFVKRMIEEHAQLYVRLKKLEAYIYDAGAPNDDKGEFANKCIQLSAMRTYEHCLICRLKNQGVTFDYETGKYNEEIANIDITEENPEENENKEDEQKD
jgi:hypothetical protein